MRQAGFVQEPPFVHVGLPIDMEKSNRIIYSKVVSCYDGSTNLEGRTIEALLSQYGAGTGQRP